MATFQPLTKEQFQKAQAAGFSVDQIVEMEKRRKLETEKANRPQLPETGIGPVDAATRFGTTFGAEIGKAGLGLGETLLKGGKFLAEKAFRSPDMAKTFDRPIEAIQQIKEGVYEKPFEAARETVSGKVGQAFGVAAPFVAGGGPITSAQRVVSATIPKGGGLLAKLASGTARLTGRAAIEGVGSGAIEFARTGGDIESAENVGKIAGATSFAFGTIGALARSTYWPEIRDSATRALGIQGKMSGGAVLGQVDKKVAGLKVLKDRAPNITVLDDAGIEKVYNPLKANFDETLQAWNKARSTVFDEYHSLAVSAGKDIKFDFKSVVDDLESVLNSTRTSTYKNAARSILRDLYANFGVYDDAKNLVGVRGAVPDAERFLADLNSEASAAILQGSDKAKAQLASKAAHQMRTILDDLIENSTGANYRDLKLQYGALKSIEGDLVRRFQQQARQLGGGLSDYMQLLNSGDIIAGILTANPQLLAVGGGRALFTALRKAFATPDHYLRRAFKLMDQAEGGLLGGRVLGGTAGITPGEQEVVKKARSVFGR